MKSYPVILIFLISIFAISCTDTITDIGKGTLSYADSIIVKADTFHLKSSTVFVNSIVSQPDSFLLGTFYDSKFGTVKADILAQVNCPLGFKFPANFVADSVKVGLSYYSCFGDTLAPIDINIYEMNKGTFSYTETLSSNLDPASYCDRSIKLGERIFKAGKNSRTLKSVRFKLDNSFVTRFANDNYYSSTTSFTNFFKGLYITANFGASTLLNIGRQDVNMFLYYHYPAYTTKDIHGKDSTVYIHDYLTFPASKEVRQVNCIQHPDRSSIDLSRDTVNLISSPANLQAQITLPLNAVKTKLSANVKGKRLTLNSAILKVNVTETNPDTILHPVAKYLLLIKDRGTFVDDFFKSRDLPSDTSAVLGRYTIAQIGTSSNYERYYSFDIAKLIANEFKNAGTSVGTLNVRLVPVAVGTTTNSSSGAVSVSSVKQQYLMNAVTIRSGKEISPASGNKVTAPMTLKLVYSGF